MSGPPRRPCQLIYLAAALSLVLACGCQRRPSGLSITAPFNDETRIARVVADWEPAGRGQVHYSVRVENILGDRLYVSLASFSLLAERGQVLAMATGERACVLPQGESAIVLHGDLAVPSEAIGRAAGFEVKRFGVPLSERGRGIYREWRLQSKKYTPAEVDAELASYLNAPPCS